VQALGRARHIALARHGDKGAQGLGVEMQAHICQAYNAILMKSLVFIPHSADTWRIKGDNS
jgi:hypothetical protein